MRESEFFFLFFLFFVFFLILFFPFIRTSSFFLLKKKKKKKSYAVTAVALGWSALVCSQLWPPVSILLPEHLRDFRQLVVGLLSCSCCLSLFGRGGSSSSSARKRARRRKQKKQPRHP